jgi:hypothetical protein
VLWPGFPNFVDNLKLSYIKEVWQVLCKRCFFSRQTLIGVFVIVGMVGLQNHRHNFFPQKNRLGCTSFLQQTKHNPIGISF